MRTEVLRVDPLQPEPDCIVRAAVVIRRGGLVAFPTETVYGLGADALNAAAVATIFTAKGRPANNPVIVHVGSIDQAGEITLPWPQAALLLAKEFWPGPLTLVLPRSERVPDAVTAGGPTVAVRMPSHPVALALIRAAGKPIAAPSANRSGQVSPTRADHVLRGLDGKIDLVLDGGPTSGGVESTVLDLSVAPPRLLRPGLIGPAEIEAVVGSIERPALAAAGSGPLPSPGLLARHYAPGAPLECIELGTVQRVVNLCRSGLRVGFLTFHSEDARDLPETVRVIVLPATPVGYAAGLYDALHRLDDAGVDRIIVAGPPDSEAWLAVRDRLHRARGNDHAPRAGQTVAVSLGLEAYPVTTPW